MATNAYMTCVWLPFCELEGEKIPLQWEEDFEVLRTGVLGQGTQW